MNAMSFVVLESIKAHSGVCATLALQILGFVEFIDFQLVDSKLSARRVNNVVLRRSIIFSER